MKRGPTLDIVRKTRHKISADIRIFFTVYIPQSATGRGAKVRRLHSGALTDFWSLSRPTMTSSVWRQTWLGRWPSINRHRFHAHVGYVDQWQRTVQTPKPADQFHAAKMWRKKTAISDRLQSIKSFFFNFQVKYVLEKFAEIFLPSSIIPWKASRVRLSGQTVSWPRISFSITAALCNA